MKVSVNSLSQDEFNEYLERLVEFAFREGALWEKCGGERFCPLSDAIKSAQSSIVYDGL